MKKLSKVSIFTILLLEGLLVSCDNFLDGGDFKEQLEKDIAYAKAQACEIRVECDEGAGQITSGNLLSKKVTDKFTVEFKISSDYKFSGWQAYSKSSSGSLSELSSEYIKFSSYNTESADGIFKTEVEFLKEAEGITIRPLCVLLPKITSITPAMESSGCDQDTAIVINFNKSVNAESFGSWTCVLISSDGEDLSSFFDTPFFSSDAKSLCITPLGATHNEKLILAPDGSVSLKNITVEVNFSGNEKDSDGITLTGNTEHKYKINKNYGNLEKTTLLVDSDENMGNFLSSGAVECIVGYSVEVQFTVKKSDYVFKGFKAVSSADENADRSEFVSFTEVEADSEKGVYKYRVRLMSVSGKEVPEDIAIKPVCVLLPKVTDFYPPDIPTGYEQNSTIKITFNKSLDKSSFADFSCVSVYSAEGSLEEYFDTPYFLDDSARVLYIPPKQNALILTPDSGTKLVVSVKIDFSKIKDADGISLPSTEPFTYRINDSFIEQQVVTSLVKTVEGTGSFLSEGEKKCTVGYTFDVQFSVNKSEYIFEGLEAVSQTDPSVDKIASFEEISRDDEAGVYKYRVRILKTVDGILIRPVCSRLSSVKFNLTGSKGKFSPTKGEYECVKTYTYPLAFDPDSDYEFIRWEIFNTKTGKEVENGKYIKIENPAENETSYVFVEELPANSTISLAVRPVVAERPQILSYSPLYVAEGVLKDSRIQLVFDYDMSEDSIYYTEDELKELTGVTLLKSTKKSGKYYGYTKGGMTFFKNISFKDNETYENRTGCFDEPYFASPRMLSVNTKKPNTVENYSQILVTIEKDFFYKIENGTEKGRNVSMAGSKKWIYQVDDSVDIEKPKISDAGSDIKVSVKTDRALTKHTLLSSSVSVPNVSASTNFNRDKKLKLDIKVTDTGSGPSGSFILVLSRVQDEKYQTLSSPKTTRKSLSYQKVTNLNGVFSKEIDLASIVDGGLSDGVYKVNFEFSDRSGNTLTYPDGGYYFTVDNAINMSNPVFTDTSDSSKIKMKLNWTPSKDLQSTAIYYKPKSAGTWTSTLTFNTSTTQTEYSSLSLATDYVFKIVNTDYAGNTQTIDLSKTSADWTGFTVSGTPSKTFYYSGDSFNKTGLTVTASLNNGYSWTVTDYSDNLGTSVSKGKTVTLSYSKYGKKKSVSVPATYYIAAADALTQTPVKLTGYSGSLSGGTYYKFGDFPQTKGSNQDSSWYSSVTFDNGWYLGSDGYFYEKCKEKASSSSKKYSDDTVVSKGGVNTKFFKVEPIVWRLLSNSYDSGKKLLMSEKELIANIRYYYGDSFSGGQDIYRRALKNGTEVSLCDYKYSSLRAYLNGSYESDDGQPQTYVGKGFLQHAFTPTAQSKIAKTTVDNTGCDCGDNTSDKIFILSKAELMNPDFGFQDTEGDDNARFREETDFAKANNSYRSFYWVRGRNSRYSTPCMWSVDGKRFDKANTANYPTGIVPALCVSTLP